MVDGCEAGDWKAFQEGVWKLGNSGFEEEFKDYVFRNRVTTQEKSYLVANLLSKTVPILLSVFVTVSCSLKKDIEIQNNHKKKLHNSL